MGNLNFATRKPAVLIAGPTASGKSALAIELARAQGGVVINADSMQVYRELRILSARPDAEEEAQAPHRLYGHVAASERYSVARWREDAKIALEAAWEDGQLPIVVGGTGLYFKALTEGLSAIPPIPAELRAAIEARADAEGVPALHAALETRDPESAARLAPLDRTRVVRALEVVEATGRTIGAWQQATGAPPLVEAGAVRRIVLEPERAELYARIGRRFDIMVARGGMAEAQALLALGLDPALPAMKAIGVREFGAHLAGELPLDEAIGRAKMETRRYAKRQGTWFRNQMADWDRLAPGATPVVIGALPPG
ncbi:tRNA (adenosine(37)-N6)-dimethylallyltransferase MiaA [Kaistia defluvii]|uniref:tRNA (adenosine(37)-N6)-dimethylallyltransferase MiaA n=1 Tax=Kaistia defluvii TaxID=410841 RepID=UPI00224E35B7|nr:tRNA (adenosine(37)-N6)-dimethylallyltransferase MiaA [Kaistia defluvii]MCX5516928.1 tRNA (adenosine(37)-N6)-dimethylallyltransferase MiaA [Kaistia defluvii]